ARLDRDDVSVTGQEVVLRREAGAVETRLLGPREDRVDVVGRRFLPKRLERRNDEGASREVVGGAHAYLVPGDVGRGEVEHRVLAHRERLLRVDPTHGGGVVKRLDIGHRFGQSRGEREGRSVVMYGRSDVRRKQSLTEPPED